MINLIKVVDLNGYNDSKFNNDNQMILMIINLITLRAMKKVLLCSNIYLQTKIFLEYFSP